MRKIILLFGLIWILLMAGCIDLSSFNQPSCSSSGPVCGIDNKEYASECAAKQAGISVAYNGSCITCVDYDKGITPSDASYVMLRNTRFDDYCVNETSLAEYYCESNTSKDAYKKIIDCTLVAGKNACENGACVLLTCTDYDNGKDVYKKSSALSDGKTQTDYCANNRTVVEYYCNGSRLASSQETCPSGYACSDGACVPYCTTTFNGTFNIYKKDNVTKGSETRSDYCVNSTHTMEYYCENNDIKTQVSKCPSGYTCSDGACISSAVCVESGDVGANEYVRGTVSKGLQSFTDYCRDSYSLNEYYCSDNEVKWVTIDCPSGYRCSNGRCAKLQEYCDDSDDGKDRYTAGRIITESDTYYDYCTDSSHVREYYCDGDVGKNEVLSCPSDYRCSNGRCVKISREPFCDDSDNGKDIYTYGWVTTEKSTSYDYCIDRTTVNEYYCNGDYAKEDAILCPSGYTCSGGKCVEETTCSDSDGGDEPNFYGIVTVGSNTYSDICTSSSSLREYYCSGNSVASKMYTANNWQECYNGAIVAAFCTDPDGSREDKYYTSTIVTRGHYREPDRCYNSTTLYEYSCDSNLISFEVVDCPFGCNEGACLPPPHLPFP